MPLIFIYGTLKKDHNNHRVLQRAEADLWEKECYTVDKYPMFQLDYPFPYIQNTKGKGHILKGELWHIESKFIDEIDRFEGVPDLYYRDKINVISGKTTYEDVNCYFKTDKVELITVSFLKEWK